MFSLHWTLTFPISHSTYSSDQIKSDMSDTAEAYML